MTSLSSVHGTLPLQGMLGSISQLSRSGPSYPVHVVLWGALSLALFQPGIFVGLMGNVREIVIAEEVDDDSVTLCLLNWSPTRFGRFARCPPCRCGLLKRSW